MTEIVINLHNGTDTVGGNANDINPLNTSNFNLTDFGTGSDSGWDMTSNVTLTANSSGRNAAVGGAPSYYSTINTEGNFFNTATGGDIVITLSNIPGNVTAFDLIVFLCTTFSGQGDLRVDCQSEFLTGWDSTGNTTGATFTLAGCIPSAGSATITLTNVISSFVFLNGLHINNVQEETGLVTPLSMRSYRHSGRYV